MARVVERNILEKSVFAASVWKDFFTACQPRDKQMGARLNDYSEIAY